MHVCVVSIPSGSTGTLTRNLAHRLQERGNEVSVVTLFNDSNGLFKIDGVKVYSLFTKEKKSSASFPLFAYLLRKTIKDNIIFSPDEYNWRYLKYYHEEIMDLIRGFIPLISIIRKLDPDIIHGHGELAITYLLALVKKIVRKPSLVTVTRFESHFLPFQQDSNITRCMQLHFLSAIDRIICLSPYTKRQLTRIGFTPTKISVIPYGIRDEFLREKKAKRKSKNSPTILFWGSGISRWGFKDFLNSILYILDKNPDSSFVIAVRGIPNLELKKLTHSLAEKTMKIEILDRTELDYRVPDIVASADVVVLPYKTNPIDPPLTLVESMALGKPVVTTNVGGNSDVVDNFKNGLLVENDYKHLAKAVIYLLSNEDERLMMGEEARKYILANYDWEKCISAVLSLYKELVEPPQL